MSKQPTASYSTHDVEILEKKTLFKGFFKMAQYRFRHRLFKGGWSEPIERELFERGHAAAMLPYDPIRDEVVIVEQIRVGALEQASPWQFEVVAGIIDTDESAEEVVRREAMEEAGVEVGQMEFVTSYYPSAGGCSERLDVFVGEVDSSKAGGIHGLEYEDEDIKVTTMSREQAYDLVKQGVIENGASIILLQWLELNHQQIRERWCA
jgi:ADP-ribose pyrophosphatase